MPQTLNRGLYRVRRAATASKRVQHAAIADVGNQFGLLPRRDVFNQRAVVIVHQTPPVLQYEVHQEGLGDEWTVAARGTGTASLRRLIRA